MLDKVDFRARKIQGNKGTLYSEKGWLHQENITILKVNACNNRTFKHMKQELKDRKGEINKSLIIAGDYIPPSVNDETSRHSISKDVELNTTTYCISLTF